MASETLYLDPVSDNAANTQLQIVDNVSYFLLSHSYPQPDIQVIYSGSIDAEGDLPAHLRYKNRQVEIQLRVQGSSPTDLDAKLAALQQKVGKINREGGVLQRTTPSGKVIYFDLLTEATIDIPADKHYQIFYIATPVVLKFMVKPFGRGTPLASVTDNFTGGTLGNYTMDTGSVGDLAEGVSGLTSPSNPTVEKNLVRTSGVQYPNLYDAQTTVKFTPGATLTNFQVGFLLKWKDSNNKLLLSLVDNGTSDTIQIVKVISGSPVTMTSATTSSRIASGTASWLRGRIEGNTIYLEYWTSAPSPSGSPLNVISATLAGSDATLFGLGVANPCGVVFTPITTAAVLTNWTVDPNVWTSQTAPCVRGVAYGVPGDVPALGLLTLTNASTSDQFFATWGLQSRYYDSSSNGALFYEAENLTLQGGSTVSTKTGASPSGSVSNNIVTNTGLTTTYMSVLSTGTLTNIGDFEVWARVYDGQTTPGTITYALDWTYGDFHLHTTNTGVATVASGYNLLDLGQIHIPATINGPQQWQARVVASTTSPGSATAWIDCIFLIPIAEGSGQMRAVQQFENVTAFNAHDEFQQTVGTAVNAMTAPQGGAWSTTGSATDFTVQASAPAGNNSCTRATTSDTSNGRFAVLGSAQASTLVQLDIYMPQFGTGGPIARYVDTSNWFMAVMSGYSNGGKQPNIAVYKSVAGTVKVLGVNYNTNYQTNNYTVRIVVDTTGRWSVWVYPAGTSASGTPLLSGQDPVLATGGALASGKGGINDLANTGGPGMRFYDNFILAAPTADAAIFNTKQAQIRDNAVLRNDSGGTLWVPPTKYEGDYLLVPPAGQEGRATKVIAKASRNEPTTSADSAIDSLSAQLVFTPRYLVTPE